MPGSPVLDSPLRLRQGAFDLARWLPPGRPLYLASGRVAIGRALLELGVPRGAAALLPAYLCDSVVAPFRAHGCAVRFFPVDRGLRPDLDTIERSLTAMGAKVLVVIDYFGFPSPDLGRVRALCQRSGAFLVEDCAHALFSRSAEGPLGVGGDCAVFSLRKTLPTPEGGVLVLRDSDAETVSRPRWKPGEVLGLAREAAYWAEFRLGFSLRTRLLSRDSVRRRVYRVDAGQAMNPRAPMGAASAAIARRTDPEAVVRARRRNFMYWLENLARVKRRCEPLFRALPEGVCPLGFPVLVDGRDGIRAALYRAGIALRTYWDVLPPEVEERRFPDAAYLRDRLVVLPVHQSLSNRHLERVIEALNRC